MLGQANPCCGHVRYSLSIHDGHLARISSRSPNDTYVLFLAILAIKDGILPHPRNGGTCQINAKQTAIIKGC